MSKTVHIIGAGGPAGVGFTRCLNNSLALSGVISVQGHDSSPWAEQCMECEQENIGMLNCDMVIPVPDAAVRKYADCDLCFLPTRDEIELCQDKGKLSQAIGSLAPFLYWIRDTQGAGGKGAQMASEYLPGRNVSVEFIFYKGDIKAVFCKERLSYSANRVEPSVIGVGSSAVSKCISPFSSNKYFKAALGAVETVSRQCGVKPHGIYGVDLKQNKREEWKVTEINPGRFMTASYAFFADGYNLPAMAVELFLGLPVTKLSGYPMGVTCIRQVGSEPVLVDDKSIKYPAGWL